MKKIGLISLALILALGTLGVGYALWSENLYIEGIAQTAELDWEFYEPAGGRPQVSTRDHGADPLVEGMGGPTGKDVASSSWAFSDTDRDGDVDTLTITIINGYPGYYENFSFHVRNNGTIPLHFEYVLLDDQLFSLGTNYVFAEGGLSIGWGHVPGEQLHPGNWMEISFYLFVLQPALQGHRYTFTITLGAVNYNESQFPIPPTPTPPI